MSNVVLGDNEFLERMWSERVARLRLGIAPVDLLGGSRRLTTLECFSEDVPRPFRPRPARGATDHSLGLPRLRRTPSARHVIAFGDVAAARQRVVVRLVDRTGSFVPRRFSIPVPTLTTVTDDELAHATNPQHPLTPRACRPVVFPSVRYGIPAGSTVIRGRAIWGAGGPPVRWARLTARPAGSANEPWLGHTDHQGEFVVFVGSLPVEVVKVGTTLDVDVTVFAESTRPSEEFEDFLTRGFDPLKLLPIELVTNLTPGDPVLAGTQLPPGYVAKVIRTVTCTRGAVTATIPVVLN